MKSLMKCSVALINNGYAWQTHLAIASQSYLKIGAKCGTEAI
jgi:hypothetical protein